MSVARDPNRPKVPDLIPVIEQLFASPGGGAGCCWHCVVEDGNTRASDIASAIAGVDPTHPACVAIASMATRMTPTQISKAARVARK
jgi:hypothetical protein